ncbi:unnamed protein product [Urochloa humidicola]
MAELLPILPWQAWLLASLLAAVYFLGLRSHQRRRGLPPGPRPLPLIGNLHLLGDQPHRSLAGLAKTHGPLMSLRLGAATTVVATSPAVAREFLQRHDAAFAARSVPDAVAAVHARNSVVWLPSSSPTWRSLRKIMSRELFAPHRLDALRRLRREKVVRWRRSWNTSAGSPPPARRWMWAAWRSRRCSTSSQAPSSRAT